jgi:rod shape determining protein RodA
MIPLRALRFLNYRLILVTLFILGVGLTFIYSATQSSGGTNFLYRQLAWIAVGMIIFWFTLNMDFRLLGSMTYLLYLFSLLTLVLVLFFGDLRKGSQSWFELGPISFQPAELAKIGVVFILARYLSERSEDRTKFRYIFFALLLTGLPMGLIILQPDLGTSLVLIPVLFGMLFVAGARMRYLLGLVGLGIGALPVLWSFLHEYQRLRILIFVNPNLDPLGAGYNAIQSKIAVGSGGLLGKGWLEGTQSQLRFLPERHTDFIFSVLGEEWGFIGCFAVLFAYFLWVLGGFQVARESKDLFGRFLAVGFVLLISSHVIINTGMTVGVMPITGIPLPFMSYGGSHLIVMMACLGLLENIHLRKTMF